MRKYNYKEIHDLRTAVENKMLFGSFDPPSDPGSFNTSMPYDPQLHSEKVEKQVQTYMAAGITAEDLIREEKKGSSSPT